MAPRRTSSQGGLWSLLKVVGVLAIIALIVGYLYGSMALDLVAAQKEDPGRGLLRFFGFELSSLVTSEPLPEQGAGTEEPPQEAEEQPQKEPAEPGEEQSQEEQASSGAVSQDGLASLELFRVQLGSFNSEDNARRLQDDLAQAGFSAFITSGPPYRVWLGIGLTREQLHGLADDLQEAGFETYVASVLVPECDAESVDDECLEQTLRACRTILDSGVRIWVARLENAGDDEGLLQTLEEQGAVLSEACQEVVSSTLVEDEEVSKLVKASLAAVGALRSEGATNQALPAGHLQLLELEQRYNSIIGLLGR